MYEIVDIVPVNCAAVPAEERTRRARRQNHKGTENLFLRYFFRFVPLRVGLFGMLCFSCAAASKIFGL